MSLLLLRHYSRRTDGMLEKVERVLHCVGYLLLVGMFVAAILFAKKTPPRPRRKQRRPEGEGQMECTPAPRRISRRQTMHLFAYVMLAIGAICGVAAMFA